MHEDELDVFSPNSGSVAVGANDNNFAVYLLPHQIFRKIGHAIQRAS